MIETGLMKYYLKRTLAGAASAAVFAAALYGSAAKELRLMRQLDNDYAGIIPAPENNINEPTLVNINTATAHQLQRLDGIGAETAQAVIEYREAHGNFASDEELLNVKGIGSKTLEKIRYRVTV